MRIARTSGGTATLTDEDFDVPTTIAEHGNRLFAVNGTNGLPVTLDQGGVFNWIDRNVGAEGRVSAQRFAWPRVAAQVLESYRRAEQRAATADWRLARR